MKVPSVTELKSDAKHAIGSEKYISNVINATSLTDYRQGDKAFQPRPHTEKSKQLNPKAESSMNKQKGQNEVVIKNQIPINDSRLN